MPKDVLYGKTLRKSFARTQEIMDMPNLLEIQKSSWVRAKLFLRVLP